MRLYELLQLVREPRPLFDPESSNVLGPCECGRRSCLGGLVVTVTPPEVILVAGIPHLLWPVIMTLLLSGGTGVT